MSRHHYIANNTKKEYLECPAICGVKIACYLENEKHCIPKLLLFKLWLEWKGDNISFYNDYEDLPWVNYDEHTLNCEWKDITLDTIESFNEDSDYKINCKSRELK